MLINGEYGTIASVGKDSIPYATPVSYVVLGNYIYIHCALTGHKIDNFQHNSNVCFSVVGKTEPIYDGNFSTYYESTVVFGKITEATDNAEKHDALYKLSQKYLNEYISFADAAITRSLSQTAVYKISIDKITGKSKKRKP